MNQQQKKNCPAPTEMRRGRELHHDSQELVERGRQLDSEIEKLTAKEKALGKVMKKVERGLAEMELKIKRFQKMENQKESLQLKSLRTRLQNLKKNNSAALEEMRPKPRGRWPFRWPRFTLFRRRVRVHDGLRPEKKLSHLEENVSSLHSEIDRLTTREEEMRKGLKELKKVFSEIELQSEKEILQVEGENVPELSKGRALPVHGPAEEDQEEETAAMSLVPFGEPVGVLTVVIKTCRDMTTYTYVKERIQATVRVTYRNLVKCTQMLPYQDPMTFNAKIQISVKISQKEAKDPSLLWVELVCTDPLKKSTRVMGKNSIGLLEILNKPSFSHKFSLGLQNEKVGSLDTDLVFNYGFYGYGYSHQIPHEESFRESLVQKSCFPRSYPPKEEEEATTSTVSPVDLTSLFQPYTGSTTDLLEVAIQKRGRLARLDKAFKECNSGKERMQFLETLIMTENEPISK